MTVCYADNELIDTNESWTMNTDGSSSTAVLQDRDSSSWRDYDDTLTDKPIDTATSDLKLTKFASLIRHYLTAPGPDKHEARTLVVDDLSVSRRLDERIDLLLAESVDSPRAGRLDDAIDVLSNERVDLVSYLLADTTTIVLQNLDDNVAHVLIRAAGRRFDAAAGIISWALLSNRASVRESAVEALADIGTDGAIKTLRAIEKNAQEFQSVREIAREYLAELRED